MTVAYEGHGVTVHIADALDVLAGIADASVDAVVTDPPYGLEFMGKEWDAPWKQGADVHAEARNRRAEEMGDENKRRYIASAVNKYAAGLPFQQWCEMWATECLRVLKPGGHLLAFGGTRTWHRLACAVEDAGFEVRDSIAWMYGSGFPKSLDVSKAIDKRREEDRAPVDAVRSWLNARRLDAGLTHDAVNKHFGHASNGGGSSSAWMTNPTSRSLPTWDQWQELKSLFGFGDDMDAEVWRLNGRKGAPGEAWDARVITGMHHQGNAIGNYELKHGVGKGRTANDCIGLGESQYEPGERGKRPDEREEWENLAEARLTVSALPPRALVFAGWSIAYAIQYVGRFERGTHELEVYEPMPYGVGRWEFPIDYVERITDPNRTIPVYFQGQSQPPAIPGFVPVRRTPQLVEMVKQL